MVVVRRHLDEVLRRVCGEETPAFVPRDQRVPRRRPERVYVDARARPGRTNDHPAVGRTTALAAMLEEVVSEVEGRSVVLEQFLSLWMLKRGGMPMSNLNKSERRGLVWQVTHTYVSVAAVKDVERTVVDGSGHVGHVVLHLELHAVALVVFATFELLVAVLL